MKKTVEEKKAELDDDGDWAADADAEDFSKSKNSAL